MPILVVILVAFAILVMMGRGVRLLGAGAAWGAAIVGLLAATGAVVAILRGSWIASLGLMAASAYMGRLAASKPRGAPTSRPLSMDPAEARAILGVSTDADVADIQAAYRRLMLRAHPDRGGSAGLAVQLNAARDCLLNKK